MNPGSQQGYTCPAQATKASRGRWPPVLIHIFFLFDGLYTVFHLPRSSRFRAQPEPTLRETPDPTALPRSLAGNGTSLHYACQSDHLSAPPRGLVRGR